MVSPLAPLLIIEETLTIVQKNLDNCPNPTVYFPLYTTVYLHCRALKSWRDWRLASCSKENIYECIRVAWTQGASHWWGAWPGCRDGGGTGTRWCSGGHRGHSRGYRQGYG